MRLPAYRPLFIVAGLLTALTYLWHESTSPDLERRHHLQEILRIIELHDAELMRDILLARAGLLPNYDALSKTGHALETISQDLLSASQSSAEMADTPLAQSAQQLSQTLQAKLTEVEYFKSDNALLRNSMTYFTKVGQNLDVKAKLPAKVERLWQLMFSFLETPEADLAQAIQRELASLEQHKSLPPEYTSLIAHGRLIVDLLPRLDVSLRGIIQIPIADKLAALQAELLQYSMSIEKRAQTYRLMLYVVALCLVVYLLYQFVRLRLSNESLRRAHEQLQQESNERLHAEIALRASEERLRSMTDSAHEAIISVDSLAKVVSWNRGAEAMFGYSETTMLGQPLLLLIPEHDAYIHDSILTRKSTNTDAGAVQLQGQRQDGKGFPLELSLSSWSRGNDFFHDGNYSRH
ncbi:DAHL domain-containing protein [Methylocucumis oryzae]|uniref:PAS domain-containing protein n=1 Tax=Methylocucumis oryzae TaxID=1632867 RepID=A0A0F3IID9_9GAMM|nr:DAHL domain-containing protein [Methylocucumis oryzae]KJV06437.1 hypothetical protein VZ94_11230 [Methylocucumis oryzae]